MNHKTESLAEVSDVLTSAPLSRYGELLSRRRAVLDMLADRQDRPDGDEELVSALRSGNTARSRLLVELAAVRAQVDELRRLNTGLGQLRPIHTTPPSLNVRL